LFTKKQKKEKRRKKKKKKAKGKRENLKFRGGFFVYPLMGLLKYTKGEKKYPKNSPNKNFF